MTIKLEVTERDQAISTKALRANGGLPAIVYGQSQEALSIAMTEKDFDKVRKEAGESTLIELSGLKKKVEVLIKDVEFDPVKQSVLHVDFLAIEQGKEMTAHVPLEFIGEAPVEASRLGIVNKILQEVEVTCKPADLPNHIDVSLETLVDIEDKILIKDLNIPKGVTVDLEDDEPVVVVSVAKEEEEEPVEAVDMESIEVEEKGKAESGDEEKTESE